MLTRYLVLGVYLLVGAVGCSKARAGIDPGNDIHCSSVAYYFARLAEQERAPADQVVASRTVMEWYGHKLRKIAQEQSWNGVELMRNIEPPLEKIKADPRSMTDEMIACTGRAIDDPAFREFRRTLPTSLPTLVK